MPFFRFIVNFELISGLVEVHTFTERLPGIFHNIIQYTSSTLNRLMPLKMTKGEKIVQPKMRSEEKMWCA